APDRHHALTHNPAERISTCSLLSIEPQVPTTDAIVATLPLPPPALTTSLVTAHSHQELLGHATTTLALVVSAVRNARTLLLTVSDGQRITHTIRVLILAVLPNKRLRLTNDELVSALRENNHSCLIL